jgi:hypothetical protein
MKAQYDYVREVVGDAPTVRANGTKAYDEAIREAEGWADKTVLDSLKADRARYASGKVGGTFKDLESLQDIAQSEAKAGALSPTKGDRLLARATKGIRSAIGDDMHATLAKADPTGFASEVYKDANKAYQQTFKYDPSHSGDWSTKAQQSAARTLHGKEGFEGTGLRTMLDRDNPEMAKHAFEALDIKGRDAIKAEIWRRIDEGASKSKVGFSPAIARTQIDKHQEFIKQFFSPTEQETVKGLQNAFQSLERSGRYLEDLGNGKFMMSAGGKMLGAGAALLHPQIAAGEGALIAGSRVYNMLSGSKAGKEWLLGMAKAKPGTPPSEFLLRKLPKVLAIASSKTDTPSEEAEK